MRYWNEEGNFQADYDRLMEQLVPFMGPADTVGGESLRAISRIYYDAYNNGFGNNSSGALHYLEQWAAEHNIDIERYAYELWGYVNSDPVHRVPCDIEFILDSMVDIVVTWIMLDPASAHQDSTVDMFDLQDPDIVDYDLYEEECDILDDYYERGCDIFDDY